MWGIKSKTGYYISLGDWSQPVQYLACFTTVHPKMDSRGFLPTHTTRGELQRLVWTSVFLSFLAFALNTYGFHIRFFYLTKGMLHMQCFKNGIQIHVHGFTVFSLVLAQFHFRENTKSRKTWRKQPTCVYNGSLNIIYVINGLPTHCDFEICSELSLHFLR